ncbi:hypothetical protein NUW58_g9384 [Xylaria curta]|uniref:Uncharacterized protein n=1 Tax=Xylaria curta TaxID=42375 RepID=A0ACC1MXK5_9PEZI|nr:hypothetical protein NUW58_g9384 [Xylaria curta]
MFLKFHNKDWQGHPLVALRKKKHRIVLTDCHQNQIASHALNGNAVQPEILRAALRDAEKLAHAQRLLNLTGGGGVEALPHSVKITVGLVGENNAEGRQLCEVPEGEGTVASDSSASDGESCYIKIHNRGKETVYVSVFNVNVAGRVTWISASFAMGIDLPSQMFYTIGHGEFSSLEGIKLSWPSGVVASEGRGVRENLVFIISNREVDLRQLSEPQEWLEKKDMTPERGRVTVQYAVKHASFVLEP